MDKVIKILMERDGFTKEEAIELINECLDELENGNFDAIGEVLGLEDDYIFDILG